jgi:tetratricopeptide (TPR) repeat protein
VNAKSAIAHRVQGLVFLVGGDDAAAFQAFSKAAQEDPHDTTSRLNMGAVLLRAGSYGKAADQYKSALAAAPDETAAQIGLAAALRGESNVQGSTDAGLLFHLLPGYLKSPTDKEQTLADYFDHFTPKSSDPKSANWWGNTPIISSASKGVVVTKRPGKPVLLQLPAQATETIAHPLLRR